MRLVTLEGQHNKIGNNQDVVRSEMENLVPYSSLQIHCESSFSILACLFYKMKTREIYSIPGFQKGLETSRVEKVH
jgi:hypothetical protein